jgi:UDP-GlcNAc:undecaprenyl-phosphate GlcNAc-1-phosphate transferase
MFYFLLFLTAVGLTVLVTGVVRWLAIRWDIVDRPDTQSGTSRKIHTQPIPLLGGLGIFVVYFFLLFLFYPHFLAGNLHWSHLLGFFAGALCLVVGGVLDDKYNLSPKQQIIFPLLAIICLIGGGVEIARLSNPLGGIFDLRSLFYISPLLITIWMLGMMYTTKLLDGVDGLVSGIISVGSFIIFLFTLTTRYYQPDIAFAAILLSGATLGFLIWNWHPAKIFLGEGGSLLLGYILGVLAIISGAKIAIALLIMVYRF